MICHGEKVQLVKRHELQTESQGFLPLNNIWTSFFSFGKKNGYKALVKILE